MKLVTENTRIRSVVAVKTPKSVQELVRISDAAAQTTLDARQAIENVLSGKDERLLVVVGPCSIHDPAAALEYARRFLALRPELDDALLMVMRVYFEKPRTTVGWKGLINDPGLDDSFDIDRGLQLARGLLRDLAEMGVPAGVEFLDILTPQYLADLVAWGAIGARTTESQLHREMASGLSCPVGFKNGTDGSVKVAVDACLSASSPHRFLSLDQMGQVSIFETDGNPFCHIILRGGSTGTNYDADSVNAACAALDKAGLRPQLMIDFSHANSAKQHRRQLKVAQEVGEQIASGDARIIGVMVESHLKEGRQDVKPGVELAYGQSITDACIGWDDSVDLLRGLADAVRQRRRGRGNG